MEESFIKIINTTYRLLDFFPDNEPLKNKAKEKTLAILENITLISDAKGWVSLKKEKAAAELLDDIHILEHYLELGKCQGWINNVNFLIIIKEYDRLKGTIHRPGGLIRQNLEIISNVQEPPLLIQKDNIAGDQISKKNTETKTSQNDDLKSSSLLSKMPTRSKAINNYSERQKKILQILQEKEKVQVSDIIKKIPSVTKRTIRRDLDILLKNREIVRIGEFNQVFYQKYVRTYIMS